MVPSGRTVASVGSEMSPPPGGFACRSSLVALTLPGTTSAAILGWVVPSIPFGGLPHSVAVNECAFLVCVSLPWSFTEPALAVHSLVSVGLWSREGLSSAELRGPKGPTYAVVLLHLIPILDLREVLLVAPTSLHVETDHRTHHLITPRGAHMVEARPVVVYTLVPSWYVWPTLADIGADIVPVRPV